MNEKTAIGLMRQEVEAALPNSTMVKTDGGSDDLSDDLPLVIMKKSVSEISTGHVPFDRYSRNEDGDATATVLKKTYEISFDLIVKSESEETKDDFCDSIHRQLIPYEYPTKSLHSDSTSWDVGGVRDRKLQKVEPNWYEGYVPVSFQYTKEVEISGDSITGTNETINSS